MPTARPTARPTGASRGGVVRAPDRHVVLGHRVMVAARTGPPGADSCVGAYATTMTLPTPRSDRTSLVTGASSGIGAAIARELASRGHGVTLVARRRDRLDALAGELAARHHVRAEVVACDVADPDQRARLLPELADRGLAVDVLVNDAGFTTFGPVHGAVAEDEVAMVRTNVEAVVDLCTRAVAGMVERRRGAVLNVASTAAFQPLPGQAGYAASKAFVLSYTEALRAEVHDRGVTVTALCPGPVATEFAQAAGWSDADLEGVVPRPLWVAPETVARVAVDGLDADRALVVPGAANRVLTTAARLAPHAVLLPLLARRHPALGRRAERTTRSG